MEFVKAVLTDIPALLTICRDAMVGSGGTWDEQYPDEAILLQDLAADGLYKLLEEGRLIGLIAMGALDDLPEGIPWPESPGRVGQLARFGLVKDCQGLGLGRRALALALDMMKAAGFGCVRLLVAASHARAIAMYERAGFTFICPVHWMLDFFAYQKTL